jgi:hypothetical protein
VQRNIEYGGVVGDEADRKGLWYNGTNHTHHEDLVSSGLEHRKEEGGEQEGNDVESLRKWLWRRRGEGGGRVGNV